MALKIMPHGRLQEWVAEEKGYFTAEGLEYSFVLSGDYGIGSVSTGRRRGDQDRGIRDVRCRVATAPTSAAPAIGRRTPQRANALASW